MAYLKELRTDTDAKRGISYQTHNFYVQAIKRFCKWMVKDGRGHQSPVADLGFLNVALDRRHDRRALAVEELQRLLATTYNGPIRFKMTGAERHLLYWLAVETGLRSNECRSLTRASFDLNAAPATVTVEAAYSKRRRRDTLPLRVELVEALRPHLATLMPAAQVFRIPNHRLDAAEMFKADLAAAGIVYRDEAGLVADFHALRHTFLSNLARSGVHPKVAQQLARHSTITPTMDRYTHTLVEEQTAALEKLPSLVATMHQKLQATGTDGQAKGENVQQNVLADCLALSERLPGPQ